MRAALLIRSTSWKSTTFWIRMGSARVSRATPVRLGLCRLPNSSFFLLPSYFSPLRDSDRLADRMGAVAKAFGLAVHPNFLSCDFWFAVW
jgi:hypothetical protein